MWENVCATRQRQSAQNRSSASQAIYLQTRRLRKTIYTAWQPKGMRLLIAKSKPFQKLTSFPVPPEQIPLPDPALLDHEIRDPPGG